MNIIQRIDILEKLGNYILSEEPAWLEAKELAYQRNPWFVPAFIDQSVKAIANQFLHRKILEEVASRYSIPTDKPHPKSVGIVMAGNLPLVGFHDFCCGFLSGHRSVIKPSSQDQVLLAHLVQTICQWEPKAAAFMRLAEMLKGCDLYIATGSNQSSVYFEHYFGPYPHIIRRNRTAVAILSGKETSHNLEELSNDVLLFFGRGCRNVTKLFVPEGYDFRQLLESFRKYTWLSDHHKYRNNYEYQLALLIINKLFYMTNGSLLMRESSSLFAPIGMLHYEYFKNRKQLEETLKADNNIQCIIGEGYIPFGKSQEPGFTDFADGIDTLQFLLAH